MCIVPAHSAAFTPDFTGGLGGLCVFIAKRDVSMNEVAYRLYARHTQRRVAKQLPRRLREVIGLAVTTPQQKGQRFSGQVLNGDLLGNLSHDFRLTGVIDYGTARDAHMASRRYETIAPIAKVVPKSLDVCRRFDAHPLSNHYVRGTAEVDVQHHDHGRRLWEFVVELVADVELHSVLFWALEGRRPPGERQERMGTLTRSVRHGPDKACFS